MPLCASVYMCLVVTCWERADLLALVCGILLLVCHFPIGILVQVWYLIVLILDLCTLTYFALIYTFMQHHNIILSGSVSFYAVRFVYCTLKGLKPPKEKTEK